jgi:3-hydroxyisobutyrate dehydrogenase-like beta-hydroxyacid dehydrogenase
MGHSVGAVLRQHGLRILTCLDRRSARTRALAAEAGFEDVPTLDILVHEAEMILCILVPAEAMGVAERIARAIRNTRADVLYVDCNAIAPQTVRAIGAVITEAGGRFADVGIIGSPPRQPGTRFYASGPGAREFAALSDFGLDVRVMDGEIGKASGLKMCYGALTKGLQALGTELLLAARLMGLEETLRAEQEASTPDVLAWLQRSVPTMPPKAYRWVGEMEEIAATFGHLGLTPQIFQGIADLYRFVAETPIGKESPESRDRSRGLDGVIAALAEDVKTAKV